MGLLAYNFTMEYVNTDSFAYADFLSRLINQQSTEDELVVASIQLEKNVFSIINSNLQKLPVDYAKLCTATLGTIYIKRHLAQSKKYTIKTFVASTRKQILDQISRRQIMK